MAAKGGHDTRHKHYDTPPEVTQGRLPLQARKGSPPPLESIDASSPSPPANDAILVTDVSWTTITSSPDAPASASGLDDFRAGAQASMVVEDDDDDDDDTPRADMPWANRFETRDGAFMYPVVLVRARSPFPPSPSFPSLLHESRRGVPSPLPPCRIHLSHFACCMLWTWWVQSSCSHTQYQLHPQLFHLALQMGIPEQPQTKKAQWMQLLATFKAQIVESCPGMLLARTHINDNSLSELLSTHPRN